MSTPSHPSDVTPAGLGWPDPSPTAAPGLGWPPERSVPVDQTREETR
jgi:hypothetical protein